MSAEVKTIKKGEILFKEGDKIQSLYLIQAGAFSLCLQRQKRTIDLFQIGSSQLIGEGALWGLNQHPFSAIATTESKVLEVPLDPIKQSIESSPQTIKILLKSLLDRVKVSTNEIKSNKVEKDTSPCPDDQISRVFGILFHVARYKGITDSKNPKQISIDWSVMKNYAQRIFGESPKRLEQALTLLVKLKMASFEMGRPPEDPEGPEQIMKVHITELNQVEIFFEFYQFHFFKGSAKPETLKVDEAQLNQLKELIQCAEGVTPDRLGVVTIEYQKVMDHFKQAMNLQINADHFARLEQKGVFCKRKTMTDSKVVVQFEPQEFKNIYKSWIMIREVDKWNEKGFVDLNEATVVAKKKTDGPCCPQCQSPLAQQAKFCSECGFKIAA